MKKILFPCLALLAVTVLFFLLPLLLPTQEVTQPASNIGLPWEIDRDEAGQTRVFGLAPGVSTLNDAIARFGNEMELAIIIAADAPRDKEANDATLESYYKQITFGGMRAHLILTLDAPPSMVLSMLERSVKGKYTQIGSRKFSLHPDDAKLAGTLPLTALTLVPNVNLNAETIVSRFGPPVETIPMGNLQHYLYPDKGLNVVLDSKGKELLQYVAPAEFERRIVRPLKPEI